MEVDEVLLQMTLSLNRDGRVERRQRGVEDQVPRLRGLHDARHRAADQVGAHTARDDPKAPQGQLQTLPEVL